MTRYQVDSRCYDKLYHNYYSFPVVYLDKFSIEGDASFASHVLLTEICVEFYINDTIIWVELRPSPNALLAHSPKCKNPCGADCLDFARAFARLLSLSLVF